MRDLGHYEEALESFDKAIEFAPNDVPAWIGRSVVLGSLGHYEEALASFDKVIELDEESSYIFFNRAEALLALNRWDEGITTLDDALQRFAHEDELNAGDTEAILRNLFTSTVDANIWRTHIKTLIDIYEKHQVVAALGLGLVRSISALSSPMVSDSAVQMWLDLWQELGGDRPEFQLPLRLLDAAVRYREMHDQRVLLELPVEERTLLEPLLEIKESSKT